MALQKVRESAVPFEVVGLVGFAAGSAFVLLGGEFPISIAEALPGWAQTLWAVFSFLGSALGLAGLWWRRDPADGLMMEACGVFLAGAASAAYGVAIAFVQPIAVVAVTVGLIGGFGVSCLWRGFLLARIMRRAARESGQAS